jgi:hypothetical protein
MEMFRFLFGFAAGLVVALLFRAEILQAIHLFLKRVGNA